MQSRLSTRRHLRLPRASRVCTERPLLHARSTPAARVTIKMRGRRGVQNEHVAAPAQPTASEVAPEAVQASSSMGWDCPGRPASSEELVKVGLSVEHCRVAKAAKASSVWPNNVSGRSKTCCYLAGVPMRPLDVK